MSQAKQIDKAALLVKRYIETFGQGQHLTGEGSCFDERHCLRNRRCSGDDPRVHTTTRLEGLLAGAGLEVEVIHINERHQK
jgi:hypothetical protein